MAKVMNCGLEVNEFEHQLCYYVNFQTNILGKRMNPLIPPAMDYVSQLFYKDGFGFK